MQDALSAEADLRDALGALTLAFSRLDLTLQHLIYNLRDHEGIPDSTGQPDGFSTLLKRCRGLMEKRFSQPWMAPERLIPDFDPLSTDQPPQVSVWDLLHRANERRNELTHSWWLLEDPGAWERRKFTKQGLVAAERVSPDDIRHEVVRLNELGELLSWRAFKLKVRRD